MASNENEAEAKEDLQEETQAGLTGPSGVKPELKEDHENDKFKDEDSDSEGSSAYFGANICKTELGELDGVSNDEETGTGYHKVIVQNYTSEMIEEEPIESLKDIFVESPLAFEKENFHRDILEKILNKYVKINVKDLQAQYIAQLRQVANIEVFTCSSCEYQTMNFKNLKCHLLMLHSGKLEREMFQCDRCDYKSKFQSHIKQHLETHADIRRKTFKKEKKEKYPCFECAYKARSEEALKRHLSTHKDKTKCDLCSFESEDKNILKQHKDSHREGQKFLCYKCEYKSNVKLKVGIHLLNSHKIANEISKRSKICEVCSHIFCNINQLRRHYVTHKSITELSENEIYKCNECGHQTKYKTNFTLHMRVHKEPEFICEICGFKTRRKISYEHHLITHKRLSEIDWFTCDICPYQARNKRLLNRHIKRGNHSGKNLSHVRNRDRLREAEEKGLPIEPIIRKYKIRKINGVEIKREKVRKPNPNPKRKRKPRRKTTPDTEGLEGDNFQQFIRLNQVLLPQVL